jgi:hypothetical protein
VIPVLAAGALAAPALAEAKAPAPHFAPAVHRDPAEPSGDPLDLRAAAFGQVGTQLSLTLRTRKPWSARTATDDSLCLTLQRRVQLGRMCVSASAAHRALVRYRGAPVRGAQVERRGRVLHVLVYPHALRLPLGRMRWFVASKGSCEGGCADRLPDSGSLLARVSAYGAPRCFGAAARAGRHGCVNRTLRRVVFPAPGNAALMPDYPCRPARHAHRYAPAEPCVFGAAYERGPPRVALIGDSHAAHLRATVEVAAEALGWRAVSLTHPGCAFSTEAYPAPAPIPERCRRHSREALRWLRRHGSVRVVVTSAGAGRGLGEGGFRAVWSSVPSSVRRIYVIRDVPRVSYRTADCVRAVRRRRAVSTHACAVSRAGAFPADPAAAAARHSGGRVRLVDLSRFFCSRARCFPVVGGAYVYRDFNHLNPVFAQTLGPYLLRAISDDQSRPKALRW